MKNTTDGCAEAEHFWYISCFVDRAALYKLVNKTNLVHNLILVYFSISTCFGQLCAHHQEKQLCLCDILYLLFCMDDCLVCRADTSQSSTQSNKYKVSRNTVVSPDDGPAVARNT